MAVPGFEPGSSGSQPLMLTTTLYHQITTLLSLLFFLILVLISFLDPHTQKKKKNTPEPGIEPGSPA